MTISIFIKQTFRSWAEFHIRKPMAFWSYSLNDMLGLALHMDVLFWRYCDFTTRFSNRDKSRNTWTRHLEVLWSIRVSYKTILKDCNITFWSYTIYNGTPHRSDFAPRYDLINKYIWIVFKELWRLNKKLNHNFKFERNLSWILMLLCWHIKSTDLKFLTCFVYLTLCYYNINYSDTVQ